MLWFIWGRVMSSQEGAFMCLTFRTSHNNFSLNMCLCADHLPEEPVQSSAETRRNRRESHHHGESDSPASPPGWSEPWGTRNRIWFGWFCWFKRLQNQLILLLQVFLTTQTKWSPWWCSRFTRLPTVTRFLWIVSYLLLILAWPISSFLPQSRKKAAGSNQVQLGRSPWFNKGLLLLKWAKTSQGAHNHAADDLLTRQREDCSY